MTSPNLLHEDVEILFSKASDGSMSAVGEEHEGESCTANVDRFLKKHNYPLERSRILVSYSPESSFTHVEKLTNANRGRHVRCDALYTCQSSQVITLPVADCVATIVYDPVVRMMGVLHLGRHSSMAGLIEHFAITLADREGSDPRDWHVWMSPSIRPPHDKLDYFNPPEFDDWTGFYEQTPDGNVIIDTARHNHSRFLRMGVASDNIVVSPVDTYSDSDYFSHRAYSHTHDPSRQGRMVVAARIRA